METRQMVHGFPVSSRNETPSVVQMTGILAEHETSVKNPSRKDLTESTMEALNRLAAIEVVRSNSCHLPYSSYAGKDGLLKHLTTAEYVNTIKYISVLFLRIALSVSLLS